MPVPPKSSIEEQQQQLAEVIKQLDYFRRMLGELYDAVGAEVVLPNCIVSGVNGVKDKIVSTMSFIETIDTDGNYRMKERIYGRR